MGAAGYSGEFYWPRGKGGVSFGDKNENAEERLRRDWSDPLRHPRRRYVGGKAE
jgi:hypothetical protein